MATETSIQSLRPYQPTPDDWHRLLFFHLNSTTTFFNCVNLPSFPAFLLTEASVDLNKIKSICYEAKALYQDYQIGQVAVVIAEGLLRSMIDKLEQARRQLEARLQSTLASIEAAACFVPSANVSVGAFKTRLLEYSCHFHFIIKHIRGPGQGDAPERLRELIISLQDPLIKKCQQLWSRVSPAKYFLQDQFEAALKIQKSIVVNRLWLKNLKAFNTQAPPNTIAGALEIKQFLFNHKTRLFKKFYQENVAKEHQTIFFALDLEVNRLLIDDVDMTPNRFLNEQLRSRSALRQTIRQQESLLQSYSWTVGIVTSALRFWMNSTYYQFAQLFFHTAEEATQTETAQTQLARIRHVPFVGDVAAIARVKLSQGYLTFFSTANGVLFFGLDCVAMRYTGFSSTAMLSLQRIFVNDISLIMRLFEYCPALGDEQTALKTLKIAGLALVCAFFIGLPALSSGIGLKTLTLFTGGFLAARAGGWSVDSLFDRWIRPYISQPNAQSAAKTVLYYGAHMTGSLAWYYYVFPVVNEQLFAPSGPDLLLDDVQCQAHVAKCTQAAYDYLGLDATATASEVRAAARNIMRQTHADHGGDQTQYQLARAAKEWLLKQGLPISAVTQPNVNGTPVADWFEQTDTPVSANTCPVTNRSERAIEFCPKSSSPIR